MKSLNLLFFCTFLLVVVGCSNMSGVYISGAKKIPIAEATKLNISKDKSDPIKNLINGHYIAPGNNLVFLLNQFEVGEKFSVDDEYYKNLTIEIINYTIGEAIEVGSSNLSFFYSEGPTGFIYSGYGYYSNTGYGDITIKEVSMNTIIAELNITILKQSAGVFPEPKRKEVEFKGNYTFKKEELLKSKPLLSIFPRE